jgi:hypothetical protein
MGDAGIFASFSIKNFYGIFFVFQVVSPMSPIFPIQNTFPKSAQKSRVDAFYTNGIFITLPLCCRTALLVVVLAGMFNAGLTHAQNDASPSSSPSS